MKDALREHITNRLGRKPENIEYVLSFFEEFKTKRGDYLLRQGDVCHYVYFIVSGCIQTFAIDKKGNESTREIFIEDYWISDIFGFQNQTPSNEFIKCVEPCALLRIHFTKFQQLSKEVPQFAAIYKQLLEVSYNSAIYRVNTLTSMDSLERLKWFNDNKPKLKSRLSSKLIASYLGISPETMTRLKAKL